MVNKRGQVTIFIIVAVVIVAIAVLFYTLSSRITVGGDDDVKNPAAFIKSCVQEELEDILYVISIQGGTLVPTSYFTYDDVRINYLCYTNQYETTCVNRKPFLKQDVEVEITEAIQDQVDNCFITLKRSYEEEGYSVGIIPGGKNTQLLPKRLILQLGYKLTLTKEKTEIYEDFDIILNNNLYELMDTAFYIIKSEVVHGVADPFFFMLGNSHLRVEINPRDDGTNIYTITDKDLNDKFQFASRSHVEPPGY